MASPSSLLLTHNWTYNVFTSFHGPDVRKTLLSHIREQFNRNGITMFDDQEIVRGATIAPSLKEAIKESRISIVILSKRYASSSWCLDELVEILECKKAVGQIVMTVFYGVDPSDVRKQAGDFGIAFNETCASKTDEERQKWSKALNDVGHIAGEDFYRWDNEAKMIKKIAKDVSDKLNATPSRDFDGMVGLEAHLREMEALLDLDNDEVKMVAITGPAGIGKTTIARALHSLLSNRFQLSCFVDNLMGSYSRGLDELRLQEKFLSMVLNQDGIRICHSGVIEERLCKQRVLVILDDVNHIKQLEALANKTTWFGPGSRIIVTTENTELLQQHGINNTYHVGFPSYEHAFEILCRYAFRQSYPHNGFEKLVQRVTTLCGNLPLGLRVVGSSLRGKKAEEWEEVMCRLETVLDRDIEDVLRVSYETLDENEKTLFLHIAIFFQYENGDLVKTMFADSDVDVKCGLKILANRFLIEISNGDKILMHKLLQQMARQAIHKQEHSKRQILMDAHEICDTFENKTGTGAVSGISFDISRIDEVFISKKAFKKMSNLRFLNVYKSKNDGNNVMHIPEGMEFPRRLRLLRWEAYPSKCLPPTFHPEYLVKLDMRDSKLEYLWQGTKRLTNLKEMDLSESYHLKELPDLSNATNLETLDLSDCESLKEIPSSCSRLHKLERLLMRNCRNLEVIPADLNLASLEIVDMNRCPKLRNFPIISTQITDLLISEAELEDVPASISLFSRLQRLNISYSGKLKGLTHLPVNVTELDLRYSDIERLPDCIKALHLLFKLDISGCRRLTSLPELPSSLLYLHAKDCGIESLPDCIKALHQLDHLDISGCKRLTSLPELPSSLLSLRANDCESLETVFCLFNTHDLEFRNCVKLCKQARRAIIRQSIITDLSWVCLPGRKVPVEFNHRARGNSLTILLIGIPLPCFTDFVVCLVVSTNQTRNYGNRFNGISCRIIKDGPVDESVREIIFSKYCRTEHLIIFTYGIDSNSGFSASISDPAIKPSQLNRKIVFEFSSTDDINIIECGLQIRTEESYDSVTSERYESEPSQAFEDQVSENDDDDNWSVMSLNPAKRLKTL